MHEAGEHSKSNAVSELESVLWNNTFTFFSLQVSTKLNLIIFGYSIIETMRYDFNV
jgi:hypothetical protein